MIPDLDILERRVGGMRDLPWPIPALVLLEMTDEDLDHLADARGKDEYWSVLNAVVRRINEGSV
jgi:hypothetical protein